MAKMIDVSPRRLRQLVQEGIVPKAERGRYNPFAVNLAYIRYLRDRATQPDMSNTDFAFERLGKTKAERELLELELAKERRQLIPRERCFMFIENIFVAVKMKITGSGLSDIEKDQILNDLVGLRSADFGRNGS
jgi:phage terminase Nu1 subunit (DNA packaging protein)